MAAAAHLGDAEYFDIEIFDDELITPPSLGQIKKLAEVFGVPAAALFIDDPIEITITCRAELVDRVNAHLAAGASREAFEEQIGWDFAAFLRERSTRPLILRSGMPESAVPTLDVWWMAALP